MHNPFEAIDESMSKLESLMTSIESKIKTPEPQRQTKFLTRKEFSELLKINVSSVFNWTKKGILTAYQMGGKVYYKLHEIETTMI